MKQECKHYLWQFQDLNIQKAKVKEKLRLNNNISVAGVELCSKNDIIKRYLHLNDLYYLQQYFWGLHKLMI